MNMIPGHKKIPGRATVLLPPGLGDIHWVFLKLQGFLAQNGYDGADAWIWDVGGPRRSADFVRRVPFVNFIDYVVLPERRFVHQYCKQTNPIMRDMWGFDFVIALNGYLESGLPIEPALDAAPINWDYPIRQTPAEQFYLDEQRSKGPWILMYFSGLAQVFAKWTDVVTPDRVANLIWEMNSTYSDHRIKLVGLPWDKGFAEQITRVKFENLVGQTNADQYFALLRGADAMVGFANGNTILTTHFGVPTIMIWNNEAFPHVGFRTNWVGPNARYRPMEFEEFDVARIIGMINTLTHKDFANV